MNTQPPLDRRAAAWLADGPTELSDRVLDAALREVHLTRQRRALRVPWRFPLMHALSRATGIAAVALVAVVGGGALVYLNSTGPSGPGGPSTPVATQAPTAAPTAASTLPPGITGWTTYTSEGQGFTMGYPSDWSVFGPATRPWQPGDRLGLDELPFADVFISPEQEQESIGLFVWDMPAEDGIDVESAEGLRAFAQKFCSDGRLSPCEEFAQGAVPMCLNAGGDPCRAAILVKTAEQQYAFFVDFDDAMFTGDPVDVRVVVVARADGFPSAARYGGSVELLKSILTTMDVWTPGQQPRQ